MWGTLVLVKFAEVINVLRRIIAATVLWAMSGGVNEMSYLSCN